MKFLNVVNCTPIYFMVETGWNRKTPRPYDGSKSQLNNKNQPLLEIKNGRLGDRIAVASHTFLSLSCAKARRLGRCTTSNPASECGIWPQDGTLWDWTCKNWGIKLGNLPMLQVDYIYICIHIHPSLTVCIHNRFSLVSTHCRLWMVCICFVSVDIIWSFWYWSILVSWILYAGRGASLAVIGLSTSGGESSESKARDRPRSVQTERTSAWIDGNFNGENMIKHQKIASVPDSWRKNSAKM
jgi:hypothetical protein